MSGIIYSASSKEDESRLRKVLISDKYFNPERIKQVIKSDIFYVLRNYSNINSDDLFVDIEIMADGRYNFKIDGVCDQLKIFGALPDEN